MVATAIDKMQVAGSVIARGVIRQKDKLTDAWKEKL
jgi:hypothetical protein